jgi:hypothetical protein
MQVENEASNLSGYFTKNAFETSPDAVVTVSIARPLRPPLGTVAEILLSLSILNVAAWPGPKEILRKQSLQSQLVETASVMVYGLRLVVACYTDRNWQIRLLADWPKHC